MWRVFLSFVVHRAFLFIIALAVINWSGPSANSKNLTAIQPTDRLWQSFRARIAEGPEASVIEDLTRIPLMKVAKATTHPYLWVLRWWTALTHMPLSVSLLLWSNIFFLLFLWELYVLLSRVVTTDIAMSASILLVLWPTSIEMSLGSGLGLLGFLAVGAVRHALESRWLLGGIFSALLLAADPIALAVLPLLFFMFYYFERHFPISDVLRRAAYFFGPVAAIGVLRYSKLSHYDFENCALMTVFRSVTSGGIGWLLGASAAGQTVSLCFFLIGAATAAFVNVTLVHRSIPIVFWLGVVLFSPYASLASRLPFAALCLQGIASASSRQALGIIHTLLILLGAYETWVVFGS